VSLGKHYFGHPHFFAVLAGGVGAYLGMQVRRFLERRREAAAD